MEVKERLMMGKVTKATIVTKPEQLPKLDTGPIHNLFISIFLLIDLLIH